MGGGGWPNHLIFSASLGEAARQPVHQKELQHCRVSGVSEAVRNNSSAH